MGIYVRYLSEIPKEYRLYGLFICNTFETTVDRIIKDKFEQISSEIGSENIVAQFLIWKGVNNAEKKFHIIDGDLRPILIVTGVHPGKWTKKNKMIKIQLGKIKTEDEVKQFLFQFTRWFANEDLGKIKWDLRLKRLKEQTKHFPVIFDLIDFSNKVRKTTKRQSFSRAVEKAIYEKYKHKCAICERETEFDYGEIDHIQPLVKGGSNNPNNLQWLCTRCNKLKGSNKTNEEVRNIVGVYKKPKDEKPKIDWTNVRVTKTGK